MDLLEDSIVPDDLDGRESGGLLTAAPGGSAKFGFITHEKKPFSSNLSKAQ